MSAASDHEKIFGLIGDLASQDKEAQRQACATLAAIGDPALEPLLASLQHPSEQVRAHVVRLLGEIGDPQAAPILVKELETQAAAVRWLAAESLVRLEDDGLQALLPALIEHSDSVWLRRGAHHVLRDLAVRSDLRGVIRPILDALESAEPAVTVPLAAKQLWASYEQQNISR